MTNFIVKHKLWIFALLVIAMLQIFTFDRVSSCKANMASLNTEAEANKVIREIEQSIVDKQRATTAIALTLSNELSKLSDITDMVPNSDVDNLIKQIKQFSDYKNLWVQVVNLQGVSLYRSWSPIRNNLAKIRPEFAEVKKTGTPVIGISSGRFDVSIKVVTPIYRNGNLVGFLDLISHFNSIQHRLKASGIDTLVVATKERSQLIKHPFSDKRIGEFYVANLHPDVDFFNSFDESRIEKLIQSQRQFWREDSNILVKYPLITVDDSVHGYLFALSNANDLAGIEDELAASKVRMNLYVIADISLVILFVMAIALYSMRKQKRYYQDILNYEDEAVLVTNGRQLIDANEQLYEYFPQLKVRSKDCICEYFENEPGFLQKYMNGQLWIHHLIENHSKQHKALIIVNGVKKVFQVKARKLGSDKSLFVVVLSDITALEDLNKKLHSQSRTDELTKIGNRLHFNESLHREIELAKRNSQAFSIVLFDIDYFKRINDQYGHAVGDQVLQILADSVTTHLRSSDSVFRIGGEEFVILLAMQNSDAAFYIAEKVRQQIASTDFGEAHGVTISLGVSQMQADDDANSLMVRADDALYQAKTAGRNQTKVL